jgi:hypothetical protein
LARARCDRQHHLRNEDGGDLRSILGTKHSSPKPLTLKTLRKPYECLIGGCLSGTTPAPQEPHGSGARGSTLNPKPHTLKPYAAPPAAWRVRRRATGGRAACPRRVSRAHPTQTHPTCTPPATWASAPVRARGRWGGMRERERERVTEGSQLSRVYDLHTGVI